MARKNGKKALDLDNAEQADGALESPRSAYEIVGIKDYRYRETSFAAYSARLHQMDLSELHDHGYDMAEPISPSRQVMIDRLERKYLRENPHQRSTAAKLRAPQDDSSIEEQAQRIMAQGR